MIEIPYTGLREVLNNIPSSERATRVIEACKIIDSGMTVTMSTAKGIVRAVMRQEDNELLDDYFCLMLERELRVSFSDVHISTL